jgi:hypothetical protein
MNGRAIRGPVGWRHVLSALCLVALAVACRDRPAPAPHDAKAPAAMPSPSPPASAPARPEDWPMHLHDIAQSGRSPDTRLAPPLSVAWRFHTSGPLTASPIVVGDTVYIGSLDGRFFALRADRWGERWRFRAEAGIAQAAVYADGIVVFSDSAANLYGLNAATGALLWRARLPGWTVSPPLFGEGLVWVGVHPRSMAGYDPKSGAQVALHTGTGVVDGVEYVADKGALAPRREAEGAGPQDSTAADASSTRVHAGPLTFLVRADGSLRALDAGGAAVWEGRIEGAVAAPPAIARGFLYVPSRDGDLYALASGSPVGTPKAAAERSATVVTWEAAARAEARTDAAPMATLNDGTRVALLAARGGWAHVRVPDGRTAWLAPGEWAQLRPGRRGAPLRVNEATAALGPSLALPTGGEAPQWSPDGAYVAYYLRTDLSGQFWRAQEVWAMDAETGEAAPVARGSFLNPSLSWSLDGRWLTFETYQGRESAIWVAGRRGSSLRRVVAGDAPAWSPTAHQLAFFVRSGTAHELWRMNSDGSDGVQITEIPLRGYVTQFAFLDPPAWHPRGVRLAVGADARHYEDGRARLLVAGLVERSQPTVIPTPAKRVRWIGWSPDGRKIAAVLAGHVGGSASDVRDERVYVYWLDGSASPLSVPHTAATWVSDDRIAYAELPAAEGAATRVWLLDVRTRRRALLLEADTEVTSLVWVPARRRLCLWSTSPYLREGKYQPAETRGWLVRVLPAT